MKKKIAIIGCGFAGAFAARELSRLKKELEITVIDKKDTLDFLPMLPDIVGRDINPEFLTYPVRLLSQRWEFEFVNEEVKSVDLRQNSVVTTQRTLDYDYLLISSGSETNFYGNDEIKKCAYKLDDVRDARILLDALKDDRFDVLLISGAGYTGIEIATSLSVYLNKRHLKKRIIIVERSSSILGPLPQWIKAYVSDNLKELGIEVLTNTVIDKVNGGNISLSTGDVFNNAMLIWVAGVRTADYVQNIPAEKNPQGRIKVDEYLRLIDNCFIIGDCAYVNYGGGSLRMAVQFAIYQAVSAADNTIRSIKGKTLLKYRPMDLGYIIPMANNESCGTVMGLNVKSGFATMMHFIMCVYRSFGLKNKTGMAESLLKGGSPGYA